jgi:hypothetical protein
MHYVPVSVRAPVCTVIYQHCVPFIVSLSTAALTKLSAEFRLYVWSARHAQRPDNGDELLQRNFDRQLLTYRVEATVSASGDG